MPYSPLGRGFLTGQIQSPEDFEADDFRRNMPRFQGENFQRNLEVVAQVRQIAEQKGCQPSQLALAWVLAQGDDIIPIPGTRRVTYLDENIGSLDVRLTPEDLAAIDAVLPHGKAAGARYAEAQMKNLNR